MRLLEILAEHAARRPDALAVRAYGPCAETPLTYGRLWESVRALAGVVGSAVPADKTVLLSCTNRPEFFVAYLGVLAAGRTVFPVHPRLTASELRATRLAADVGAVIGETAAMEAMEGKNVLCLRVKALKDLPACSAVGTGPGSPGLMLQSSGTTGLPKIVYRDGPSLDAVAANVARSAGLTPEDRVLGAVPLGHSYGMENALLSPVWAGACVHLCDGFDVPVVTAQLRGERGATVLPGAAFIFEMLGRLEAAATERLSLRLAYSAGSPLSAAVAGAFADRYGLAVGQLYGATEVGSVTFNEPGAPGRSPSGFDATSVGVPMDGVRIATLEHTGSSAPEHDGHVVVRAPSMLSRYVGEPSDPFIEHDGAKFFPTGDLGRFDAGGRLWITGRLKLLIDIGGVKVNPLEVEQVLAVYPGVGRCVVIAVPVSETVSRVKAIVTPATSGVTIDLEALRGFARERLAGHKVPRVFEVRDTLPLSPTGKVLRWRLAAGAAPT